MNPTCLRGLMAGLWLLAFAQGTAAAEDMASLAPPSPGNRLTYLDGMDPFYVGTGFPRLTTPQWVGQPGVEAVVILAIDDMTDPAKYEAFLRPILERLKQIEGRAPVSIMTRSVTVEDPQLQRWLKEGLSLEVHTVKHPCPLLANGDFAAAAATYYDCVELLSRVPGNEPVAFRMPCCDSMDSTSPRFFAEIFNQPSPQGKFLTIDSSVMDRLTSRDPALPRGLVLDAAGQERFAKYFPARTNVTTRVSLGAFATTVENYPYPYVIGKLCWEFPCAAPSDWEAFNCHGATNEVTVADWKAGLDATVLKRGVFTMVFHPHGWIRNDQLVELIDYAHGRYGGRIKFLTFREAQQRINHNLLLDQPLRAANGADNGVRLLDLNGDGFVDVMIGNQKLRATRVWEPASGRWVDSGFPTPLVTASGNGAGHDAGVKFGLVRAVRDATNEQVIAWFRNETGQGAWYFEGGKWREEPAFFEGLTLRGQPVLALEQGRDRGVRFRDVDNDGQTELLVANGAQNAIFAWQPASRKWEQLPYRLPEGEPIVNAEGQDDGLRFVDLNGDGYDDIVFSNEKRFSVHLFIAQAKPWLGWEQGWSYTVRSGEHGQPGDIPMFTHGGPHRDNGAWFHAQELWVQNEDTSQMPDKVWRTSFKNLLLGNESPPKSTAEALAAFRVASGFRIELVAAEPLITDPVAFDWGPDGRLWVVEMRDYPLGLDGRGKPGGVVRVLADTDGDGSYDKSTVFLEGLRFPNGLLPWRRGLLVSAAPDILYAEDTDGDGKADVRKVLLTGFGEGNQQHRVNGLEYGLDNWVYAANGGSGGVIESLATGVKVNLRGHDLRFQPDNGQMELQPGATQFGRHRNDWGDWFGNDNSHWLWHYFLPEHYLERNPHLEVHSTSKLLANYDSATRLYAISRPQQRFNWPTHLFEVTSACSATPYRDDLFGDQFSDSVFICEPANNVVHREVLETDGVTFTSRRAPGETNSEFLASTDNWFRPVMVKTGPDGALYVADMYRLIIEHPEYFPEELKHRPDLRAGEDKGRIYRIVPVGAKLRPIPRLDRLRPAELVAALDSPNGWQRDTAQRLLVQAHDPGVVPALEALLRNSPNAKVRLQALATLAGLQAVAPRTLSTALSDRHYAVRRLAIALAEPFFGKGSLALDDRLLEVANDPDLRVRYQIAFSLGDWKTAAAGEALGRLALKDWADPNMQTALLSSAPRHLEQLLTAILNGRQPVPPTLFEACVRLAGELPNERALAVALRHVVEPVGGAYAAWQVAGVAGLLDALETRKLTLNEFRNQCNPELGGLLSRLEPLLAQARRSAVDPRAAESERLLAVRLLGRGATEQETDRDRLGQLLDPQNPEALQKAALTALRRAASAHVLEILLRHWKAATPTRRQEMLNVLFSRGAWLEAVLAAVETGRLSVGELGAPARERLLHHSSPDLERRAARVLSEISADRLNVLKAYRNVPSLTGNADHGHSLYTQNCSICHQFRGEGHSLGPDLGTVADKPVRELLVAILDPNQAVDPAYTSYTLITRDERELSGILVSETPNSITLRLPGGAEEVVLRSNVKELTSAGRSLMPEGFETGLRPQDLADVIAYLLSPGKASR